MGRVPKTQKPPRLRASARRGAQVPGAGRRRERQVGAVAGPQLVLADCHRDRARDDDDAAGSRAMRDARRLFVASARNARVRPAGSHRTRICSRVAAPWRRAATSPCPPAVALAEPQWCFAGFAGTWCSSTCPSAWRSRRGAGLFLRRARKRRRRVGESRQFVEPSPERSASAPRKPRRAARPAPPTPPSSRHVAASARAGGGVGPGPRSRPRPATAAAAASLNIALRRLATAPPRRRARQLLRAGARPACFGLAPG